MSWTACHVRIPSHRRILDCMSRSLVRGCHRRILDCMSRSLVRGCHRRILDCMSRSLVRGCHRRILRCMSRSLVRGCHRRILRCLSRSLVRGGSCIHGLHVRILQTPFHMYMCTSWGDISCPANMKSSD